MAYDVNMSTVLAMLFLLLVHTSQK